jgi:hypothetical protein
VGNSYRNPCLLGQHRSMSRSTDKEPYAITFPSQSHRDATSKSRLATYHVVSDNSAKVGSRPFGVSLSTITGRI